MRLDVYLVENGYFTTRSKASAAIKDGTVLINNRRPAKAGMEVSENDIISVKKGEYDFVSRGGFKLLGAIQSFNLNLEGYTILDIGASTGGFTDCALQHKAKKVYAYDVGHDQLDEKISNDTRVIVKEGINCRTLTKNDFEEEIDMIVMDVSFISCTKMFEAISNILASEKEAVILFKPQFEVGSQYITKQGIVNDDKIIKDKFTETISIAKKYKLGLIDYAISPIKGGDGNKEYLLYLKKDAESTIKDFDL